MWKGGIFKPSGDNKFTALAWEEKTTSFLRGIRSRIEKPKYAMSILKALHIERGKVAREAELARYKAEKLKREEEEGILEPSDEDDDTIPTNPRTLIFADSSSEDDEMAGDEEDD